MPAIPENITPPADNTRVDYIYTGFVPPLPGDNDGDIWIINMPVFEYTAPFDYAASVWGLVRAVGGVAQSVAGLAGLLAPEPTGATKVAGGLALGHGLDDVQTGFRQFWTG